MKKLARKLGTLKDRFMSYVMLKQCGVQTEAGDHLVEVLGTIIIAVVVLILFREQITNLFKTIMTKTNNQVDSLFTTVAP